MTGIAEPRLTSWACPISNLLKGNLLSMQEGVQELVIQLCKNRMAAALHAWRERCLEVAAEREAERQSLQAAVRRLARARQAAVLGAWQLHAKAKSAQRQLCLHAIRQFPQPAPELVYLPQM